MNTRIRSAWRDETLDAITSLTLRNGYAPTLRELMAVLHLETPSAVSYRLRRLRVLGLVEWQERLPRTLRVTDGRWPGTAPETA